MSSLTLRVRIMLTFRRLYVDREICMKRTEGTRKGYMTQNRREEQYQVQMISELRGGAQVILDRGSLMYGSSMTWA